MANYAMFVIICASKIKLIKVKLNPICAEKIVYVRLCARWERGRWVGSSTSLVPRPQAQPNFLGGDCMGMRLVIHRVTCT